VGGRAVTLKPTVLRPLGQELRWLGRVLGPGIFDAEHAFTIEQLDDGQVRLVQHEQFRGVLVPFMGRSLDRRTLPAFEQMNQALKRRAEQPRP
jgi:hypothetical protein